MLKVNNKDNDFVLVSLLLIINIFHTLVDDIDGGLN